MQLRKVSVSFGNIPAGTRVWLTPKQASAREHLIVAVGGKDVAGRQLYKANHSLGFKAGEELAVEGELDRGMKLLFGLEEESAVGGRRRPATTKVETPRTREAREKAKKRQADAAGATDAGAAKPGS